MNRRRVILIAAALMIAIVSVVLIRNFLDNQQPVTIVQEAQQAPQLQVLVAAQNLPTGTLIQPDQLRWRAWPEDDNQLERYIVQGKNADFGQPVGEGQTPVDMSAFVGSVVRQGLNAGEPITEGRLIKPGERGFLAAVLNPDMRAVSVPINAVSGIAGFVFPGDRVDLILTHNIAISNDANRPSRVASETILSGVRVLAIDQSVNDQNNQPQVAQIATLEVLPKEAEVIMVVRELGQLTLSLRALVSDEESSVAERRREAERLLSLTDQKRAIRDDPGRGYMLDSDVSMILPAPPPPEGSRPSVRIVRGAEAVRVEF